MFDGQHRIHALQQLILIRPIQNCIIQVHVYLVETEEQIYELNKYTNFQPLWAKDNLSKGNKWSD